MILALSISAGCAGPSWRTDWRSLNEALERTAAASDALPTAAAADPADDARLGDTVDLETVVRVATERNADVRMALAMSQAAAAGIARAWALDDPMLDLEFEGMARGQPLRLDRSMETMVGLSQMFPAGGVRDLRTEAAVRDAQAARHDARRMEREAAAEAAMAFWDYFRASKELETTLQHIDLLKEFESIAESRFRNGSASQQDVLRPQVELVMLHNDALFLEQKVAAVRSRLNVILHRPEGAALGPALLPEVTSAVPSMESLQDRALETRPEIAAADARAEAARLRIEMARREAVAPELALGMEYVVPEDGGDSWNAMIGINLPWLGGKHRPEIAAMAHEARAAAIALEAARNRTRSEVREAWLLAEAARKSLLLYDGELDPKSRQAVDASRTAYETDKATFLDLLDAERSRRDVELGRHRAAAEHGMARAALDKAVGETVGKR